MHIMCPGVGIQFRSHECDSNEFETLKIAGLAVACSFVDIIVPRIELNHNTVHRHPIPSKQLLSTAVNYLL